MATGFNIHSSGDDNDSGSKTGGTVSAGLISAYILTGFCTRK